LTNRVEPKRVGPQDGPAAEEGQEKEPEEEDYGPNPTTAGKRRFKGR